MPKILFIQPTQYGLNGKLCKQKKIYLPGLVFPLLAAYTPNQWEIEICIEVVDDVNYDSDADLIGLGSMGFATYRGLEIADEFRRRGKKVVMGGYMASMVPDYILQHVDSVVIGDAEKSYLEMLDDFEASGDLKPIYNQPVNSIDGLPVPKYELLLDKKIAGSLPVQAGRGCPHTCSFCSIACLYKGKYMFRPVDEVVRDIAYIKKLGLNRFYLIDDNIVSNPGYLRKLCDAIVPLKMKWMTQCSLEISKYPDLMKKLVRSGAEFISFGIESITQEGLNKLDKKWLRVDHHESALQTIKKAGILISSEMIIGTDSDTEQSIKETYQFINRLRIPIPRFYILTPIPGSEYYEELKNLNRLITEDLQKFNGSECVHIPEKATPQTMTRLFWWLYNQVYSLRSIMKRTLFNPDLFQNPAQYLFAFFVNLHYRRYVKRHVPPNIL